MPQDIALATPAESTTTILNRLLANAIALELKYPFLRRNQADLIEGSVLDALPEFKMAPAAGIDRHKYLDGQH